MNYFSEKIKELEEKRLESKSKVDEEIDKIFKILIDMKTLTDEDYRIFVLDNSMINLRDKIMQHNIILERVGDAKHYDNLMGS